MAVGKRLASVKILKRYCFKSRLREDVARDAFNLPRHPTTQLAFVVASGPYFPQCYIRNTVANLNSMSVHMRQVMRPRDRLWKAITKIDNVFRRAVGYYLVHAFICATLRPRILNPDNLWQVPEQSLGLLFDLPRRCLEHDLSAQWPRKSGAKRRQC